VAEPFTSFRTPKGLGEARRQSFDDDILHFQLSLSLSLSPPYKYIQDLQAFPKFSLCLWIMSMEVVNNPVAITATSADFRALGSKGLRPIRQPTKPSRAHKTPPVRSFPSKPAGARTKKKPNPKKPCAADYH